MTRQEYLAELNMHLMSLSDEERQNAVRFYEEYFEDAGAENEQSVMDELGKPYTLAKSIICEQSAYSKSRSYAKYRESMGMSSPASDNAASVDTEQDVMPGQEADAQPHTQYTAYNNSSEGQSSTNSAYDTSYESYKENYTASGAAAQSTNTASTAKHRSDGDTLVFVLGLIFGVIFGIPLLITAIIIFICCAVGVMGLAVAAVIAAIFGLVTLGTSFGAGMFLIGAALICAGVGFLLALPAILGIGKFIPWTFKMIGRFFKRFA